MAEPAAAGVARRSPPIFLRGAAGVARRAVGEEAPKKKEALTVRFSEMAITFPVEATHSQPLAPQQPLVHSQPC